MQEVRLIDGNRLAELFEAAAERGAGVLATVYHDAAHFARTAQPIEPEVRHGRWIKSDVYTFKKCSECGAIWDAALCENIFFIYCPRCGSKNGGADNG